MERTSTTTPAWWPARWPIALAWVAALDLACLPLRDFWYPDEPDLARVSMDMVARSDYLQPFRMGKAFDDYPPLFYWVAGVFGRAGGWSELSLRLPTLLCAVGLLAAIGAWVRRRFDERVACWSVVVLGSAYTFHWQSINMHLDMLLALGVAGAVLCFDLAGTSRTARARTSWYAVSALAMGVASLTKGPLGLALPAMVLGLDALLAREWRRLLPLATCTAVGSLLFGAWALAFSERAGGQGLIYFLIRQNLDRFRGGRSHEQPFYYYLGTLWKDLAPWTLLIVPAWMDAWRRARRGDRSARLLLCWFGAGLAFFTAAASKRSVYLLPILPAAGVLLARYVAGQIDSAKNPDRWARAQLALAAGGLAAAGLVLAGLIQWLAQRQSLRPLHVVTIGITAATLLACAVALWRSVRCNSLGLAWSRAAALALVAYLAVHALLLPSLDEPLSAKSDARWLAGRVAEQAGAGLGYFGRNPGDVPKETTAIEFYGLFTVRAVSEVQDIEAYLSHRPASVMLVQLRDVSRLKERTRHALCVERRMLIGDDEFVAVSSAGLDEPVARQAAAGVELP